MNKTDDIINPRSSLDKPLPQFLRDMLASPARRDKDEGLHAWLFRTAKALHSYRDEKDIIDLLYAATSDQYVRPNEIEDAVRNSKPYVWQPGQKPVSTPKSTWPGIDHEILEMVQFGMAGFDFLRKISPVVLDPSISHTEEVIDHLFPENPLICVGDSMDRFKTGDREFFRGTLSSKALIVPSPMSARQGKVKGKDRLSDHTLENTGPRMFIIIEQDKISGAKIHLNQQAAVIGHLATKAPLIMVVHSGGKSLHAWFYCHGKDEKQLRNFMEYAVSLGADPALWTKSQFVRMPGGTRQTGERQQVVYWDPEKLSLLRGNTSHE